MPVTNYFWDGGNLLQEYDDAGATIAQYSTEPESFGNVSSQRRSGQSHYYHHDPLGSTTELTNTAGDVTDTRRYKAFGETVEQSGSTTFPFQYVGQKGYYFDPERGMHYVQRRDLRTASGRWTAVDPIRDAEPSTYAYVGNNPVNALDPSGLLSISYSSGDLGRACGYYNIFFTYQLDETIWHLTPAGLSYIKGFIVQQVSIWHVQQSCPAVQQPLPASLPGDPDKVFWEAWPVITDGKSNVAKDQDYHPGGTRGEWGYRQVVGETKFFPSHDVLHILGYPTGITGDLTKDRDWGINRVPEAGPALSTEIQPNWWSDRPIEGPVTRSVRVQWCCCDASRPGTFSIRPAKGEVVSDDE